MAIIIFAIHVVSIYSMQIDCVYVNIDWIEAGKYYMNEISFSDIVGDHSAFNKSTNNTYDDVFRLRLTSLEASAIPKGIGSYFPNLQQLKWMSASRGSFRVGQRATRPGKQNLGGQQMESKKF